MQAVGAEFGQDRAHQVFTFSGVPDGRLGFDVKADFPAGGAIEALDQGDGLRQGRNPENGALDGKAARALGPA